jgi:hypothetical protein
VLRSWRTGVARRCSASSAASSLQSWSEMSPSQSSSGCRSGCFLTAPCRPGPRSSCTWSNARHLPGEHGCRAARASAEGLGVWATPETCRRDGDSRCGRRKRDAFRDLPCRRRGSCGAIPLLRNRISRDEVERAGIEPETSGVQGRRSPSSPLCVWGFDATRVDREAVPASEKRPLRAMERTGIEPVTSGLQTRSGDSPGGSSSVSVAWLSHRTQLLRQWRSVLICMI